VAFDLEELASLALFARVVEARSFTAAAEKSGIAKSAVSKRIAQLERRLSVQLLRRSTRKLTLTEEGLRFYEHCTKLLDAAKAAEDSVASASENARGILRVNAPITFSQMHLGKAIARFLEEQPEVDVHLSTDDRWVDVFDSAVDVVVRIGRLPDAPYVARKLFGDRLVVCGAPAYLDRVGRPASPEELVHHQCMHYAWIDMAAEWRFRGPNNVSYPVPVKSRFVAGNGTVLKEAALAGAGLCVVPLFMVAEEVDAGKLELLLEGYRRASIGVYAVVASARHLPKRTRVFLDFLSRYFGKMS
jgi:DNA-binding transcriptional LysR family regulator